MSAELQEFLRENSG